MGHDQAGRRRYGSVAAALTVLTLAACGSSDSPPTDPTAPATAPAPESTATSGPDVVPSDSASDTATETAADDLPDTDPATAELAAAGTLRRADYPRGWTVVSPASPIDIDANQESCSYRPDGPEADLLPGAIRQGPHVRLRGAPGYVHSQAYAFPDSETAEAWVDYVDSRRWARCVRRQLQAFQDEQDSAAKVTVHTRETPALGEGGFVSYASFAVADGEGEIEAFTEYHFYRLGRVVIRLGLDIGALTDEQYDDYTAGIDQALPAAYDRVYALDPEAPAP